jgi:hypothetical protein
MSDIDFDNIRKHMETIYKKKDLLNIWNSKENKDVWDASEDYGSRRIAEITPRPRMTLWDAVKSFFSEGGIGLIYTRKDLIRYLERNGFTHFTNSMDTYRNYLYKAEYLTAVRRGFYRLTKEIPVDLSISDVKNEAYGMKEENRLDNLINNFKAHKFIDIAKPTIKKSKRKYAKPKKRDYGFIQEDEFKV